MKTTQKMFMAAAVVLSGTVALAQDDPMTDDTAPVDDPYTDAAPADTPPPVDVDIDTAPAPAPTVVTPIIIEAPDAQAAPEKERRFLGFIERPNFGGAIAEVKAGVGGGDYTENSVQNRTGAATGWDVRAVFGGHSPIALEGAYVGSSRNVDNPVGAIGETQLVSNGVEGDLRLALPIAATEMIDVRPFAFGGLGWQYMSFWGDGSVNEDLGPSDNVMTVPAGVGIDIGVGPLNLEGRGTYRFSVGDEILGTGDNGNLGAYMIGGALGLEF